MFVVKTTSTWNYNIITINMDISLMHVLDARINQSFFSLGLCYYYILGFTYYYFI